MMVILLKLLVSMLDWMIVCVSLSETEEIACEIELSVQILAAMGFVEVEGTDHQVGHQFAFHRNTGH